MSYISIDSVKVVSLNAYKSIVSGWRSLSWKQQSIIVCSSIGSCLFAAAFLHNRKKRHKFQNELDELRSQGYYETDALTSIIASVSTNSEQGSVNIDGFHTCNDNFTFTQCLEFWTNIAIENICFRSVLHYRLNTYFWIQCSKNQESNVLNNSNCKQFTIDENTQLTSQINRSKFYQLYGFDIVERVKFSFCKLADL